MQSVWQRCTGMLLTLFFLQLLDVKFCRHWIGYNFVLFLADNNGGIKHRMQ